ncbi:glycosyltransferase family 2 protein [Aliarcobacter butzleri]|uniref:Glycosyltransferase family 2 protein n=1 Tax=Aliarcobacter butzleri TaxID=28197 RepID=A0AAW6VQL1_9BACT|nr:glycosyltransferase family 2 protein [Aliarcobacter butzleri]MDK2062887.1 glycosyltransferase family 2 protein [Aliarcobacter butzleri]
MKKEVSVVLPTIGRLEYLDLAIESLLNQEVQFDEIIVFDNSVEQNLSKISKFRDNDSIIWRKSGKQLNAIDSWNTAVRLATKDYVTIMGDDDILCSHFNKEVHKYLAYGYKMILLPFSYFDEKGDTLSLLQTSNLFESISSELFRKNRVLCKFGLMIPGVVFKKNHFEQVDGFTDTRFPSKMFADELLWFKISFLVKEIGCSNTICWNYRVHKGQTVNVIDADSFIKNSDNYVDLLLFYMKKFNIKESEILPNNLSFEEYKNKFIVKNYYINTQMACFKKKLWRQFLINFYSLLKNSNINKFELISIHFKQLLKVLS